ncbi:hypothetical protein FQN54_000708 [Arachnomyces sp. PD_36]|nr:hypothetical protein FQN54_000708 [Arachnomyces sp. PD_36]
MKSSALRLLVLVALVVLVSAWSPEDHEIFRVRDEILSTEGQNVTFYDFLGIKPSASQDDIIKSYRKKAKTLHPDKVKRSFTASHAKPGKTPKKGQKPGVNVSKGPSEKEIQNAVKQAEARYARMGVVKDILRGPGRARYDHFLKNGFPRWKGTGYYYSRFRPGLGSVLAGLFMAFGGAAHYGALILGWKRQREFVDRYIRHARRAAWGDELGIKGLPGVDSPAAAPPPPPAAENQEGPMNRRQKRMMDRENRKDGKGKPARKGSRSPGTATPTGDSGASPTGEKKRVVAENGKVLIVDSIGNVFLEEENEDGVKQEFLLDIDEIHRPTIRDTMLFRLPAWFFQKSVGRFTGSSGSGAADAEGEDNVEYLDEDADSEQVETTASQPSRANGVSKRKGKRGGQRS